MASRAAIFAIGNPVALEASAEDRDTRGFISMTTIRPVRGCTANWMLQPPVSTPTARAVAIATSRMCWYSRSVSVIPGAGDPAQVLRPAGDARAGATERERRPDHHREAQLVRRLLALAEGVADLA